MKVINSYVVSIGNTWHMLYETEKAWFVTSNGAFGQKETHLEQIQEEKAKELIAALNK